VKETLAEANGYESDAEEAKTVEADGTATITNTHAPETTEATVKKVWDDNGDKEKKRPKSLTVTLSDGTEHVLSADNGWTVTVTGLPMYVGGEKIRYTWTEGALPEGYYMSSRAANGTITTITNTLKEKPKPEPKYEFSFTKEWQGGKEDTLTFTLYKSDGTVHKHGFSKKVLSDTTWKYTAWLSAEDDYYVIEESIPGYQTKYVNVGAHADVTDRCYNGGKIINYKVPKTGDAAELGLWAGMVLTGFGVALGALVCRRRKKEEN